MLFGGDGVAVMHDRKPAGDGGRENRGVGVKKRVFLGSYQSRGFLSSPHLLLNYDFNISLSIKLIYNCCFCFSVSFLQVQVEGNLKQVQT